MKFEIETPRRCDDCVFCEEFAWCIISYRERKDWNDVRQEWCPFDCGQEAIKAKGITVIPE